MKRVLFLVLFFQLIACTKQYPLITGTVSLVSSKSGESHVEKGVNLDLYTYEDDFDLEDLEEDKSLYHTVTNRKGAYRIEKIRPGKYIVYVSGITGETKFSDVKTIEIIKEKSYECDFKIGY